MTTSRALAALGLWAVVSSCDGCGDDAVPTLPAVAPAQHAPRSGEDADGSAAAVERPVIVHDQLPGLEGYAVEPVGTDWATFRGDESRGGYRETRSIRQPRVRWSIGVGVMGYANTPIVTRDAIFVGSQGEHHNMADPRDGVYAVDPATGAIRWHYAASNDVNGTVLAGSVLVAVGDGRELVGLDAATGRELWKVAQECLLYHAPAVRDGKLLLIRSDTAGGVVEIDAATGAIAGALDCHRAERGAVSAAGSQVFRASDQVLSMIDPLGVAWTNAAIGDAWPRGRWSPPLVLRDVVIEAIHRYPFPTAEAPPGTPPAYRPAAVARWRDNGQLIWAIDVNDPGFENTEGADDETPFLRTLPWVLRDRLFWTPTNAGTIVAYDVTSGDRLEHIALPDCRKRAFASIVGTQDMGYYARHDGVVYGFSPAPLALVWSMALGQHATAGSRATHHPVRGACFVDPRDGSALFSTPAIGEDGTLYVGSGDGWLYALSDASW